MLGGLHRAGEGCWWETGAAWVEVPSQGRGCGGTGGMVFRCGMSRRAVSLPHCRHAAPRDIPLPLPYWEHWVLSVILAGDGAVLGTSSASQRIVAVGRSEPSPVSCLSGTHGGPGYTAGGEV